MDKKNKQPIRCFEGNTQPHEAFWTFRDVAEGEEPEMELYGYISEWSWFEDDITPRMFREDLMKYGQGGPIKIRINSYGGDVVAASMISSIMREYPGKITVQIDGIAASAATIVAVAGAEVKIQDTAYFMIHDPSVVFLFAQVNIEEMTRLADSLQAVKEGIINSYQNKTGLTRSRLSKLMTDETWMDAQRALDLGFVDEILINENSNQSLAQQLFKDAAFVNCINQYSHVPPEILEAVNRSNQPATLTSSESMLTEDDKREAQALRETVKSILGKESLKNG